MHRLVVLMAVCALGLVGCGGDGGGEAEECADWEGEWTASSVSCDGVSESIPSIDYVFAADCTGEMTLTDSANCESTAQIVFVPNAVDTTIDLGAVTCSATCTPERCQPTADWGQPFLSAISHSDDTFTMTFLATPQMVSDEVTACQAGETQVSVLVAR